MRILHLLHDFPPESVGGVEVHVQRLTQALEALGHDVAIVAGTSSQEPVLQSTRNVWRLQRSRRDARHTAHDPEFSRQFATIIREFRPDIVHVHHLMNLCWSMPLVARLQGARVVFSVHDYWLRCPQMLLMTAAGEECSGPGLDLRCARCVPGAEARSSMVVLKALARKAAGRVVLLACNRVIAPSALVEDLLSQWGVSRSRIRRIPYGVPRLESRARADRPGLRTTFGYVGAIKPHKGLTCLFRAFGKLGPAVKAELQVFGDIQRDPHFARRLSYLAANVPRIRFAGAFPPHDLEAVLSRLDVLVVPSLWRETGPQVAREALAGGVPVLASDIGGLREVVVPGRNGILFPAGDADTLAHQIEQICMVPGVLASLDWEPSEIFSVADTARAHATVYHECLEP